MNKLIILGIVGAAYLFSKNKKTEEPKETSFFEEFNNKIIIDINNRVLVVIDGKIYIFTNEQSLKKWQIDNPENAVILKLNHQIWEEFAIPQAGGVNILPGY